MKSITIYITMFLFCCSYINSQWQQTASTPQGAGVTDMVVLNDGTLIVTTASYNWPNGQPGGIRRSTDGGNTWQNINEVYNARTLWLGSTGKIFASYWPYPNLESAYYSTNGGLNWTLLLTLSGTNNIFAIAAKDNDNTIFLGTRDGVRRSTNGGSSWINLTNGFAANAWIYDLDVSQTGQYIAAGTSKGAYVSSNNGTSWLPVAGIPQTDTILSVKFARFTTDAVADEKLNAGSSNGNFYQTADPEFIAAGIIVAFLGKTSDIGTVVTNDVLDCVYFAISGYGSDNTLDPGFLYSTDNGVSWIQDNSGLTNPQKISSITHRVNGGSVKFYAGFFDNTTNGARVLHKEILIGIQQISGEVPRKFSLLQNYPNPFNPATNIEFEIPKSSFVKLAVYDMLGREVEILLNKELKPGKYKADWNASAYPSGVYFYKLTAGEFSETKKMALVK